MHAVRVRFDQILNVHRHSKWWGGPKVTFSFVCAGVYTPYITVYDAPDLREGMEVVALLREPGNWKSLAGWKDIATGAVVYAGPRGSKTQFVLSVAVTCMITAVAAITLAGPTALWLAAFGSYGTWGNWKNWRRTERDSAELSQLQPSAA